MRHDGSIATLQYTNSVGNARFSKQDDGRQLAPTLARLVLNA